MGVGSVLCGLVLTVGHLVTVYVVVVAYMVESEPWDHEAGIYSCISAQAAPRVGKIGTPTLYADTRSSASRNRALRLHLGAGR